MRERILQQVNSLTGIVVVLPAVDFRSHHVVEAHASAGVIPLTIGPFKAFTPSMIRLISGTISFAEGNACRR
jgi:hypothetical protein